MDFEQAEQEISQFLADRINESNVEVVPLPEVESEFEKTFGKLKVIVAFSAEESEQSSFSVDGIDQEVTITFTVLVQGKLLRGDRGVYQLAQKISRLLVGFRPTDGDRMIYAGSKFIGRDNGVFQYGVDFKTRSILMSERDEETGPPFSGGIIIN